MADAVFSPCGAYRYTLTRRLPPSLEGEGTPCLFVMLNPSTADHKEDDPTIRRCAGFASAWGCRSLTVVNLFGLRATDPKELLSSRDPAGPENAAHVVAQLGLHNAEGGIIVAAWGSHSAAREALDLQREVAAAGAWCLGATRAGAPRHPLYMPASQALLCWEGPR